MKKLSFACLLLILSFVGLAFAQEKNSEKLYEVKGVLKDKDGAYFAGLPLFFNKEGKREWTSTDLNGEFSVKLESGSYKVTVNPSISKKFVAYIEIRNNAINPNNIEFTIETNPICCGDSSDNLYPTVLNSVKPLYPPAARAVRAIGEVVVIVKINIEGKVNSAKAESGHPLLRTASEIAAKQWLFEPNKDFEEREAKITFVFLDGGISKKELKHYSNPYRLEIISVPPTIDY